MAMKTPRPDMSAVQNRVQELLLQALEVAQNLAEEVRTAAGDRAQDVRGALESGVSATAQQARGAAEPTAEQLTAAVEEFMDWAEANRDRVAGDLGRAREAIETRLAARAVVTRADLDAVEERLSALEAVVARTTGGTPAPAPAPKKAAPKKAAAKKSAAKKSAAGTAAAAKKSAAGGGRPRPTKG